MLPSQQVKVHCNYGYRLCNNCPVKMCCVMYVTFQFNAVIVEMTQTVMRATSISVAIADTGAGGQHYSVHLHCDVIQSIVNTFNADDAYILLNG